MRSPLVRRIFGSFVFGVFVFSFICDAGAAQQISYRADFGARTGARVQIGCQGGTCSFDQELHPGPLANTYDTPPTLFWYSGNSPLPRFIFDPGLSEADLMGGSARSLLVVNNLITAHESLGYGGIGHKVSGVMDASIPNSGGMGAAASIGTYNSLDVSIRELDVTKQIHVAFRSAWSSSFHPAPLFDVMTTYVSDGTNNVKFKENKSNVMSDTGYLNMRLEYIDDASANASSYCCGPPVRSGHTDLSFIAAAMWWNTPFPPGESPERPILIPTEVPPREPPMTLLASSMSAGAELTFPVLTDIYGNGGFVYLGIEKSSNLTASVFGNKVTAVTLPAAYSGILSSVQLTVGGSSFLLAPGATIDFSSMYPNGVDNFSIAGSDAALLTHDGTVPVFVLGLRFQQETSASVTFGSQTVPEPTTLLMIAVGAIGLLGCRKAKSHR